MDEPFWPILWSLSGLPILSLIAKLDLRRKASTDYAYYLEWRSLRMRGLGLSKLSFFFVIGLSLTLLSVSAEKMVVALSIAAVCGTLLETTTLIGRPHPTPAYIPSSLACKGCTSNEHDACTNTRMLDSFQSNFASRDGLRRPICCCGFRIGALRPMSI